jgi:branched-chain amino acid transport system permease protein
VIAGAAAARLRGPYLAGATLALAVGLPRSPQRFPKFLGAPNGLTTVPPTPPRSLGETFPLERWQAWIAALAR